MGKNALKKKIHAIIESTDDEEALNDIYDLAEDRIAAITFKNSELSKEQLEELDRRHEDFLSGKVKYLTHDEFIKKIEAFRKKLRKKKQTRSTSTSRV